MDYPIKRKQKKKKNSTKKNRTFFKVSFQIKFKYNQRDTEEKRKVEKSLITISYQDTNKQNYQQKKFKHLKSTIQSKLKKDHTIKPKGIEYSNCPEYILNLRIEIKNSQGILKISALCQARVSPLLINKIYSQKTNQ